MSNTSELVEWFEENFSCWNGPLRSYFEIPYPITGINYFVYEAFVVLTRGQSEAAEQKLTVELRKDFEPLLLKHRHTTLVWRLPEKISFAQEAIQLYGKMLLTREEQQEGKAVPSGAVICFDTGCWHEDKGHIVESRLYTRLVIPVLNWLPYPNFRFRKIEGAAGIYI